MVFSSLVFLLVFLPCVILLYYILPTIFRNGFLLIASLFFFVWGGVSYSVLILLSVLVNFLVGKKLNSKSRKSFLILGMVFNLGMLVVFKYVNFLVGNINLLSSVFSFQPIPQTNIVLPIGISFYTFQAMSYLIDVYYGKTQIQKRIDHLGLYISLFPQLIAGPIVRYHEIKEQLVYRIHSTNKFADGISRFIKGLGKKIILANTFAFIADQCFNSPVNTIDTISAWVAIVLYAMQIYFDFSGYSDMAIGLGKMFGFELPENFNFPYISKSITDFWRRWHITLSSWFRDYLYIPLGGNRKGKTRMYFNLIIVFMVTGFWHGASWNFLIWGLFHGVFLLIEKQFNRKNNWQILRGFQHLYTLLVVLFAWVFFRSDDLNFAINYCKIMIGIGNHTFNAPLIYEYINLRILILTVFGVLLSTPVFLNIEKRLKRIFTFQKEPFTNSFSVVSDLCRVAGLIAILLFCITELSVGTYNPFIYFRF